MTDKTLEEQGFIKHDGGPMPECYGGGEIIDLAYKPIGSDQFIITSTIAASIGSGLAWVKAEREIHHRRHISTETQLAMAVEAMHLKLSAQESLAMTMDQEQLLETLTLIKQRNPEL